MNILRRGRLQVKQDEDIMRFTSSMEADKRIFDADIEVDKAHVIMLKEQGIIKDSEFSTILTGRFPPPSSPTGPGCTAGITKVALRRSLDLKERVVTGTATDSPIFLKKSSIPGAPSTACAM